MDPDFRLDGEVALVTGGTAGIGLAIAAAYVASGARVVVCGRDAERGEIAAKEVGALFVRADVTEEDDVRALVQRCRAEHGSLSVLVNNAGPTDLLLTRAVDGPLGQVSLPNWELLLRRTLTSAYLPTRYALEPMVEARRGAIVNISSMAASRAVPGFDTYAAGKGGLEAMTRAVASGYAHLGIRCNAIQVGIIATDHGDQGRRRGLDTAEQSPDAWRKPKPPPAGRPEDVAAAAVFLASGASAYVTGAVLPVDGGVSVMSLMPWQTPRPGDYEVS